MAAYEDYEYTSADGLRLYARDYPHPTGHCPSLREPRALAAIDDFLATLSNEPRDSAR